MYVRISGIALALFLIFAGKPVFAQGHYHYQPHTTTHVDTYRHGGHYHTVPHTTTHVDRVYHPDPTYYPSYVTPSPTQVLVPSPVVTSPTLSPVTTVANASTTSTTTALKPNTIPYKGRGVVIRLPEEVGGEVSYIIDKVTAGEIRAGMEQKLDRKKSYEIRFSRGTNEDGIDLGEARYTISEGTYEFAVTERGWDLFRQRDDVDEASLQVPSIKPPQLKNNKLPKAALPSRALTGDELTSE